MKKTFGKLPKEEKLTVIERAKKISERVMEMTGDSDDLLKALDQWENERQALIEFFELVQMQEKLLKRAREAWHIIHVFFWGKSDIGEFIGLPIENVRQSKIEMFKLPPKIVDAAHKMELWEDDGLIYDRNKKQTDHDFRQLVLDLKVKNEQR